MKLPDDMMLYEEVPTGSWRHYTIHGVPRQVPHYLPNDRHWTWKPLQRAYRQRSLQRHKRFKMVESKRSETILKNLAQELLTEEECQLFKQALHHFRVSHSVTSLCQQLKQVINTTPKILLLVELSMRMPSNLQEDFHRLCSLQFPNYDTYLKIFTSGNSNEMPRVIAQDSSGRFRIVSRGSEKKMMMRYNNQKQTYEIRSLPGTSVTSGVYSNGSDSDDVFDEIEANKDNQGRATPVHLEGRKNVHKVFLNRHEDGSLGLGITGGKEYGTELIINVVEEDGPAALQGLQVGDKILEVNGHNFHNITHAEAVMIMRNAWNLIILVERPDEGEDHTDVFDKASVRHQIKDIELVVFPSNTGRLGCITQRLPNFDLMVQNVESNSSAEKAGLLAHDLIYKVDGVSVRELSEKQIVMLTHAKRINLNIKRYVDFEGGEAVDGPVVYHTPAPQQKTYRRSESEPRSDGGRHRSAESHHSSHHSSYPSPRYVSNKENIRSLSAHSAHSTHQTLDQPEHLIYGNRPVKEANWIISPKPRQHRYTQRKGLVVREVNAHSFPIHGRSRSEERYSHQSRPKTIVREISVPSGGVSRYVRNRSQTPHKNTIQRVHHEDNVIRAIQMGLEKRQHAIRRSVYQMPDPVDYEWEI